MSSLTVTSELEEKVQEVSEYFASPRFKGIVRLYSPRQVVEQQGTIRTDYAIARKAAEGFYARLRELFAAGKSITTFGPYSPGQAATIKRAGIEGIYLGGWATSAKGSITEDPGADLASYPLSQVPDEAASIPERRPSPPESSRLRRTAAALRETGPPLRARPTAS